MEKPQTVPKPQILLRNSLLQKQQNSDSNGSTIVNKPKPAIRTGKPMISEKPQIPSKPSLLNNSLKPTQSELSPSNSIEVLNNDETTKSENSIPPQTKFQIPNAQPKQMMTTTTKTPTPTSSPLPTRKSLNQQISLTSSGKTIPKFRINSAELNRLRLRKDFFDNKNVDQMGKFLIYDVREDEEQIQKMNEICELLVAGGYFRARIKGLHNFDKIIGGMCWAIQMCNIVDLDVDIFYQENLSIGQKIALTEKIVNVLQRMKCPFKLEPHQIQGMDCIHIYPAIQWLVKKSLETRKETADYHRQYATWQFQRLSGPNLLVSSSSSPVINFWDEENIDMVVDPLKENLRRRFLHPNRSKLKDEQVRVRTTLLEYGIIGSGPTERVLSPGSTAKTIVDEIHSESSDKSIKQQESKSEENLLLDSMTEMVDDSKMISAKVPTSIVGRIVSEQSEEIKRLAEDYERKKTALSSVDSEFIREETMLKNEISAKKKELNRLMQNGTMEKLFQLKEKLKILEEKSAKLIQNELDESEQEQKEKLRLTELLNVLRRQKTELKQHCREEKQRLEQQIEMLEPRQTDSTSDQQEKQEKLTKINNELKLLDEKHSNVKKELSLVNKKYAIIQRKFDDIPNRTELAQYQKRFLELYNQLSTKHNETKKFFILYNTLADERMYLEKEFNLINSILENFQKASTSSLMVKDEFLIKFQQTVETIMQNKNKVEQRLQCEKDKRNQLNTIYSQLVDEQRLYYIAVKAFKEECKINEQLIVQLDKSQINK